MRPLPLLSVCVFCSLVLLGAAVGVGYADDARRVWIYGSPGSIKRAAEGRTLTRTDSNGMTPLHYAAQHNSGEAVFTLLSLGADVNARTSIERTPLMLAAMDNPNEHVIMALAAFGADRDARDVLGKTALLLAVEKGSQRAIIDLLQYGADPFVKDASGKAALDYLKSNTALAGSEARRQLLRYADPGSGLYRPEEALPQRAALPWRSSPNGARANGGGDAPSAPPSFPEAAPQTPPRTAQKAVVVQDLPTVGAPRSEFEAEPPAVPPPSTPVAQPQADQPPAIEAVSATRDEVERQPRVASAPAPAGPSDQKESVSAPPPPNADSFWDKYANGSVFLLIVAVCGVLAAVLKFMTSLVEYKNKKMASKQ